MFIRKAAFAVAWLSLAGSAAADSFDINLHEDAVRGTYTMEEGAGNGTEVEVGLLYNSADEIMAHIGAHVSGQNWSKKGTFDIRIGGRALTYDSVLGDAYGLALGARVRFSPVKRVGVSGHAYYGPDIIMWGDGRRYVETGIRADYQLLPQAFVYVGYRQVEFDMDLANDVEADESAHVGMLLLF